MWLKNQEDGGILGKGVSVRAERCCNPAVISSVASQSACKTDGSLASRSPCPRSRASICSLQPATRQALSAPGAVSRARRATVPDAHLALLAPFAGVLVVAYCSRVHIVDCRPGENDGPLAKAKPCGLGEKRFQPWRLVVGEPGPLLTDGRIGLVFLCSIHAIPMAVLISWFATAVAI